MCDINSLAKSLCFFQAWQPFVSYSSFRVNIPHRRFVIILLVLLKLFEIEFPQIELACPLGIAKCLMPLGAAMAIVGHPPAAFVYLGRITRMIPAVACVIWIVPVAWSRRLVSMCVCEHLHDLLTLKCGQITGTVSNNHLILS